MSATLAGDKKWKVSDYSIDRLVGDLVGLLDALGELGIASRHHDIAVGGLARTIRAARDAHAAGLPKGVLNIVHGGREVVDALLTHPKVKAVSFVGSTPIAKHIYETGTKHGKRVQANGGAKNYIVVMPDADVPRTVESLATRERHPILDAVVDVTGAPTGADVTIEKCADPGLQRFVRAVKDKSFPGPEMIRLMPLPP